MTASDPNGGGMWHGDGWIDVSRPLTEDTPVWPGDRALEMERVRVDELQVTAISTTCHLGTHVDSPLHLERSGIAAHEIPLGRLMGPAEVVRLPAGCGAARPEALPLGWVPRHPKVLFRSDSHPLEAPISEGFTALSAELVHWLADHGASTVGIDTPSVDPFESVELEAHHALAERGMTWIEGLDLTGVQAGRYVLIALPLPLRFTDAAPVRAILRRL